MLYEVCVGPQLQCTADKEDSTFMILWSLTPEIMFKCLMREGLFVANRSKMLWPQVGVVTSCENPAILNTSINIIYV